ncbi:hypothetical protein ACL598_24910 [Bordetella bronchialis]|uniref:Uncharacterized protein n=1 Tax=Bordetella bronchialis TaxID=463025 RepID=A0A193G2G9_9BORD|nr:hypothetical protein [Bordetella bronchialis]ANN74202.1 hypothetical protein BAU08_25130 [Bordetella bronchialis]
MTSDPVHASSSKQGGASAPPAAIRPSARPARAGRRAAGSGSWLMASAAQRMAAAALVCAALWGLTAWAMGWW